MSSKLDEKSEIVKDNFFLSKIPQLSNDFLKINLTNSDRIIKFRSLNKDQNFIFIKIKNTIHIYDLVRLNLVYTFHLNEEIVHFEISPSDSSVILNTLKNLQIHSLNAENLEDYNLKINYKLSVFKEHERIENISVSSLGDLIATVDSYHVIRILDKKLDILKSIKHELNFFENWPSNFLGNNTSNFIENLNLHYFNFTYDTKHLCLCKFGANKISFIYKNKNFVPQKANLISNDNEIENFFNFQSDERNNLEYLENFIEMGHKIIYMKEMQKDLSCYTENENSSIFFILTESLNFNIMRKVIQAGTNKPELVILSYLDLSMYTDNPIYPNISFSLLYDNQNPIFNSNSKQSVHFEMEGEEWNNESKICSGIINSEHWKNQMNNLENSDGFFQTHTFYFKNISTDYLIFNFSENIILYKIEGLNSYSYNNINIETICRVFPDEEYSNDFILLKFTKTLDRKFCVYFIDENNLIRKYFFKSESSNRIHNTEKFLKIYSNIITVKFNEMNRKTLILEYRGNDSLIYLLSSKLEITQIIVLKEILAENLKWVENSDFIIFHYNSNKIVILNYYSKYISKRIVQLNEKILHEKLNVFDLPLSENNRLIDIKFNTNFIGILNKVIIKANFMNEIKFNFLAVSLDLEIFLVKVSIEDNNTLSNETEFSVKFSVLQSYDLECKDLGISQEDLCYHKEENINNMNVYLNKKFSVLRNNFIFTEKSLVYYSFEKKLKIFSLVELSENGKKIIFQNLLLDELIYSNIFMNNYLIFITGEYLNSFDFSTFSFYRVKNDYIIKSPKTINLLGNNDVKDDLNKINIDLIKFGTFPYVFFTYTNEIKFVRIPRNKNINEEFQLEFVYNEEVSLANTKLILKNDFILLNPSQIFKVFEITKRKQNIEIEDDRFLMLLINSNPISLFDFQTFLDFFLSGNEEIIKLILNIFCNLFNNIKDFTEKYKTSKLVPNFLLIENINCLYKIMFDNDLNVLSMIGKPEEEKELSSPEEDEEFDMGYGLGFVTDTTQEYNAKLSESSMESVDEFKQKTKEKYKENDPRAGNVDKLPLAYSSSFKVGIRNSLTIKYENPKLQFLSEKDDQETNPINILGNSNKNYEYLKHVYDIISQESTRNLDNFTKYMILKITSKNKDLEQDSFKFSTADLCWITFISDQEYFIKFLSKSSKNPHSSIIKWRFMKMFNVPLWIKNDLKLKDLIETVARNEIKEQNRFVFGQNDTMNKNIAENVALFYFIIGKKNAIIDLLDKEPWNDNIKKFIMRDFSVAKNRKIAKENADDLMKKKKFIFAAFFYLLADDLRGAVDMTLLKMKDINLTIAILRLFQCQYSTQNKYTYTMEMLLQEYFINFGMAIRDPWLVIFGYIGLKKIDFALEYILNYDCQYAFGNDKEIMENIEYFGENIEIIRNIFGINTFDYKLLIFAKNLEKIYLKQLEENRINVKSVQNTNFEDIWDFVEDSFSNVQSTNTYEKKEEFKDIIINYENLSRLCLTNSLSRGILYAPIMNIYKSIFPKDKFFLDNTNRELLRNLLCQRIMLDILYLDEERVDNFFYDIEKLFVKLEENKILKKQEIYNELNKILLWFDRYRSCAIPCKKSNKLTDNLIRISQFTERLLMNNISSLIDYNITENLNVKIIKENNLKKMKDVSLFLKDLIEYEEKVENEEKSKKNLPNIMFDKFDVFNNNLNCQIKTEQNLLIFRIIFSNFIYLLFCCKITLSYNKIRKIISILDDLSLDYNNIFKYNEKSKKYLDITIKYINCITEKIEIKQHVKHPNIYLYAQILNFSFISQIFEFLKKNVILMKFDCKKSLKTSVSVIASKNKSDANYVHERFKFIPFIMSNLNAYLENFDNNFDRYVRKFLTISIFSEIHDELKMIYMKDLKNEQNFFKFYLIPIRMLFKNEDKLKIFEENFKVKENIIKYISGIFKYVEYERDNKNYNKESNFTSIKQIEGNKETVEYGDLRDNNYVDSGYTPQSIKFIHSIFKNGVEVLNYGDAATLHGFSINSCDPSNMVVGLGIAGHRKINILFNLLIRKRSEDYIKIVDIEPSNQDEIFSNSRETDFRSLINNQIFFKYNEILTIIQNDICKKVNLNLFNSIAPLPPHWFMDCPSEYFKEDISTCNIAYTMFANNVISHPLLPLYCTTNNRGIISVWSYDSDSKKSINDYSIEAITKESMNKTKIIRKIKFNSYGNEFLSVDDVGNLNLFNFTHEKDNKLPFNGLSNIITRGARDAIYINNSGVIATTAYKNQPNNPCTILWDFLMPSGQNMISEIDIGGNLISSITTGNSSILVANDKPGNISFIDIRKMSVLNTFQAHLDEIKSFKISERENMLVTFGKDGFVKIWNLSEKSSPKLIDSMQPFQNKDSSKGNFNLDIFNGLLFASNDNSIKFLRNKIY